jgi:hypothetical protein
MEIRTDHLMRALQTVLHMDPYIAGKIANRLPADMRRQQREEQSQLEKQESENAA